MGILSGATAIPQDNFGQPVTETPSGTVGGLRDDATLRQEGEFSAQKAIDAAIKAGRFDIAEKLGKLNRSSGSRFTSHRFNDQGLPIAFDNITKQWVAMPRGDGVGKVSKAPTIIQTGDRILGVPRGSSARGFDLQKVRPIPASSLKDQNKSIAIMRSQLIPSIAGLSKGQSPQVQKILQDAFLSKDPTAFGKKTILNKIPGGDLFLQFADKKGSALRAIGANIGSLKILERSGAAVTAAEFPRLKPFIPKDGDSNATVLMKLIGFSREYHAILKENGVTFSKRGGFIPNPALEDFNKQFPRFTDIMRTTGVTGSNGGSSNQGVKTKRTLRIKKPSRNVEKLD